jgi:hypothetical protein
VIRRGWEDVDKGEGIVTQEGRKKDVGGVIQPFRGDSHHIKARRQDRCPSLPFSSLIIEIADQLHVQAPPGVGRSPIRIFSDDRG